MHLAVLLFGVAGLFGKIVDASPALIVFGRTLFASAALLAVLAFTRTSIALREPARDGIGFVALGALLAIHWLTFFHAIRISSVTVGLLSYASFPLFIVFLEPLLLGGRIKAADVALAAILCAGLMLMVPSFDLSNQVTLGVMWGVISGLAFALLSILNRKFVTRYASLTVALYQDAIACACLLPWVWGSIEAVTPTQWLELVALGVVCTALAHTLFIYSMRRLTARLASMIACLEPCYGVLFALVLLGEIPAPREWMGGAIILVSVVLATRIRAPA